MAFAATQPGTTQSAESRDDFERCDYGHDVAIDLSPAGEVVAATALHG